MSKWNVMLEYGGNDYNNWISMEFDAEIQSDRDFVFELQRRALDQGLSVKINTIEE